jgi:hypothetical protein
VQLLKRLEQLEATSVTSDTERELRFVRVGFKDDCDAIRSQLDVAENELLLFFIDPAVEYKFEPAQ